MLDEDFYKIKESYQKILQEGYLHVPEKIIKDIKDYYKHNFEKLWKSPETTISKNVYPSKIFFIDFTGTNYEFLNLVKPKPTILVNFVQQTSDFSDWDENIKDTVIRKNRGNINLELIKDPESYQRMMSSTIEHEVVHYVQTLLQKYKHHLAGSFHSSQFRPNIDIFGHSYSKEGMRKRKVKHDHRPIEYYTNLMSAIRELYILFYEKHHSKRDWSMFKQWERPKVYFFKHFMDVVNGKESDETIEKSIAVDSFRNWKDLTPKFYNKMIKIAYDTFVNKEPNFDPKEIKDELKSFKD